MKASSFCPVLTFAICCFAMNLPALNLFEDSYAKAIRLTGKMSQDAKAQALAGEHGLQILDLTWEDTGRYEGSAVGPNISDMTIQVARKTKQDQLEVTCMPVIRFPNFSDVTCDLDPRDFTLLVGNQKGAALKRASLLQVLEDPMAYLTRPESWKAAQGKVRTLLCERDSKVLVSAQACFLPIPKEGKATFNPVLFNYQSMAGDPAVLTILATREGTSMTIIDNKRDAFESGSAWGQRLFFNANGQRASLTGERESEFAAQEPGKEKPRPEDDERTGAGLNMVLLIQVPLKQKTPPRRAALLGVPQPAPPPGASASARSDVENAVIGHGELEGPFTEIDNLPIERDTRFPVRVTVQFYKATSNGVVSAQDLKAIKSDIDRIYSRSDAVGSLVTAGKTGRVTEYEGAKIQPPDWWEIFWARHQKNTGDDRETAMRKLRKLLGQDFQQQQVTELFLRDLLRK